MSWAALESLPPETLSLRIQVTKRHIESLDELVRSVESLERRNQKDPMIEIVKSQDESLRSRLMDELSQLEAVMASL